MKLLSLALSSILVACGTVEPETQVRSDSPELSRLAMEIIIDSGWDKLDRTVFIFFSEDLHLPDNNTDAVASAAWTKPYGLIYISPSNWEQFSKTSWRKAIIKHELGHALFNLPHSNDPKDFMYPILITEGETP